MNVADMPDETLYACHRAGQVSADEVTAELARRHLANLKDKWKGRIIFGAEIEMLALGELTEAVMVGAITVTQRGMELERRRVQAMRPRVLPCYLGARR